jgi:hypothetical protein
MVVKKLSKLKPSKSPGPDGFHPKLINKLKHVLGQPLSILFNLSILQRKLPQSWKDANITAIFKKGSRKEAGNYRPVSLTSILCKVLESFVRDSIVKHMNHNKLFSPYQHGFRSGRSCITQLLQVMDHWTELLDMGANIDCIYLDFRKAFDTVPHKRLAMKLQAYGIKGNALEWVKEFLKDRKQRVVLGNSVSNWTGVTSGVPQGSVFGPVLFLVFINDLPLLVKSFVELFADDTKVYATVQDENDNKLQEDLDALCRWSEAWLLGFNISKCKVMHLGRNNPKLAYFMTSQLEAPKQIIKVQEEKDLGITCDPTMKFSKHIANCASKANQILGLVRRTFEYLDKDMFLILYKTLVRPHMEYGSTLWNPCQKKDIRCLEKVQRRATKLVKGLNNLSYSERLIRLGLPTLEYRRKRNDMIQVFKIIKGFDIVNKDNFFTFLATEQTRGHNYRLYKFPCQTQRRQNSFTNRVVNTWNSLDNEVVSVDTINAFKSRLNQFWSNNEIKFCPSC